MKNQMKYFFAFTALFSIIFAEYGGGYTGAPFRLGVNAREMALSGALVAESNYGFNQFSNPALITATDQNELGLTHFSLPLDRSVQVISFNKTLPPQGALGLAFFRAGTDNIQGRNFYGQKTEEYSVEDFYGMLSFGLQIKPKIAFGINLKAFFNNISGGLEGKGIAFDFGLLYNHTEKLTFAGKYENLFSSIIWNEDGSNIEEMMPGIFSFGATYITAGNTTILGQYDGYVIPDHEVESRVRFGFEMTRFEKFFIRAGFFTTQTNSDNSTGEIVQITPTIGLGFAQPLWKFNSVRFDYALDWGRRGEGIGHLFSWSIQI